MKEKWLWQTTQWGKSMAILTSILTVNAPGGKGVLSYLSILIFMQQTLLTPNTFLDHIHPTLWDPHTGGTNREHREAYQSRIVNKQYGDFPVLGMSSKARYNARGSQKLKSCSKHIQCWPWTQWYDTVKFPLARNLSLVTDTLLYRLTGRVSRVNSTMVLPIHNLSAECEDNALKQRTNISWCGWLDLNVKKHWGPERNGSVLQEQDESTNFIHLMFIYL